MGSKRLVMTYVDAKSEVASLFPPVESGVWVGVARDQGVLRCTAIASFKTDGEPRPEVPLGIVVQIVPTPLFGLGFKYGGKVTGGEARFVLPIGAISVGADRLGCSGSWAMTRCCAYYAKRWEGPDDASFMIRFWQLSLGIRATTDTKEALATISALRTFFAVNAARMVREMGQGRKRREFTAVNLTVQRRIHADFSLKLAVELRFPERGTAASTAPGDSLLPQCSRAEGGFNLRFGDTKVDAGVDFDGRITARLTRSFGHVTAVVSCVADALSRTAHAGCGVRFGLG